MQAGQLSLKIPYKTRTGRRQAANGVRRMLYTLRAGQAEQWWAGNAPLLAQVFDRQAYPLATRVGSAAGAAHGSAHDPDHAYRFGLQRVLDGLAALIDNR